MLLGWDQMLSIAGVVLLAGELARAAKLISLFVQGHSLTLLVATLSGWRVDATLVDVVIALSVVYVGVQGLRGRPFFFFFFFFSPPPPPFFFPRAGGPSARSCSSFGLVHGLGLSTRLQDLGLAGGRSCSGQRDRLQRRRRGRPAVRDRRDRRYRLAGRPPMGMAVARVAEGRLWRVCGGRARRGGRAVHLWLVGGRRGRERGGFCEETASDPPPAIGGQHPDKSLPGRATTFPAPTSPMSSATAT